MACGASVIIPAVCLLGLAIGQPAPRSPVHGGWPRVSPDGSLIAFGSQRDGEKNIFVISPDGSGERQVTQGGGERSYPIWDVETGEILYAMPDSGGGAGRFSHLYAIRPVGGDPREIGRFPGRLAGILRDRSRVIASVGPYPEARLVISRLDGMGAVELTNGTPPVWTARMSPDGVQFAFPRRDDGGGSQIWAMRPDGTALHQLTRIPASEGHPEWPAWSADGSRLAVQVGQYVKGGESKAHIWTVDLRTGHAFKLAPHDRAYLDETPSWFPDGKRIAFQSDRTGRMEIWSMNADGGNPVQITGSRLRQ